MLNQTIGYVRSKDLLADSRGIIESARCFAYRAINVALVRRNWLLGKLNASRTSTWAKKGMRSMANRSFRPYPNT